MIIHQEDTFTMTLSSYMCNKFDHRTWLDFKTVSKIGIAYEVVPAKFSIHILNNIGKYTWIYFFYKGSRKSWHIVL